LTKEKETMRAVWLEDGRLAVRELPVPVPGPDEALIKLIQAGVCGTDLALANGYYDYTGVPGHEFVGEVVDTPEGSDLEGQRVVGEINLACGACDTCAAGRPHHCPTRSVLGIVNRPGVFADYFTLPVGNLHPVPEAVSDDGAVFTEPVAAACQVLEQVTIRSADRVLVIGAGRLGQLIAQVLADTGCALEAVAKYPGQRALLAARGIPVREAIDPLDRGFDVVLEATGDPGGFAAALGAVRPGGTLVLKSTYHGTVDVDFSSLVVDEITLIGSRCGPFPEALQRLASGAVDPIPLIADRFGLAEAVEAFARAGEPGAGKVLLRP
jgi:threonine dehydrogenase-like Zn-dependent dehydrogenase